jgi:hypothetical protein
MLGFAGVTVIDCSAGTVTTVLPVTDPNFAWIVAVPEATAVTTPALLTVATPGVPELHVTCDVRFCVPPPV